MAQGKINDKVALRPIETSTKVIVVDVTISYRLILGRQWIEEIRTVTSPCHQCIKFPYQGKIIKVMGDELMEVEAHLVAVPTTTPVVGLTPSRKDSAVEAVDSVKQIFTPQA